MHECSLLSDGLLTTGNLFVWMLFFLTYTNHKIDGLVIHPCVVSRFGLLTVTMVNGQKNGDGLTTELLVDSS